MTVKTAPAKRSPARAAPATTAKADASPAVAAIVAFATAPSRNIASAKPAEGEGKGASALSVEQLVALKEALGFADYRAMADALGLSEVSVKRMMTNKQSVTKQVAFVLIALRYFAEHPRAAKQFDEYLMAFNERLPKVS